MLGGRFRIFEQSQSNSFSLIRAFLLCQVNKLLAVPSHKSENSVSLFK